MTEDDELKDWEIQDEEPPEKLKQKWERESEEPLPPVSCPACKKENNAEVLECIFCGTTILESKSGFLTKLLSWFKRIF